MRLQLKDSSDSDRRMTDRFPLENALRYRFLDPKSSGPVGTGQTLNMSSGGMLLKVEAPLPVGEQIEVSVDWPAQLNARCGLKLVALGKVVRSTPDVSRRPHRKVRFPHSRDEGHRSSRSGRSHRGRVSALRDPPPTAGVASISRPSSGSTCSSLTFICQAISR